MKHRYLFGLLIIVICSCLYLFQVIYTDVKEKTIDDLNSRQLIHARQADRALENYFSELIAFLTKASENSHIIAFDSQGKDNLDFALKTGPNEIKAISRVDEKGRIVYTLPYNSEAIGRDISSQKHVQKIMNSRRSVVSDVFTSVQGYDAVAIHVPVFKGNEFRGTLGVLIDFQSISKKFIEDIRFGETGYAWMTSREGIELYCPVPGHTGKSVFENYKEFPTVISMAKEMVKGNQGVAAYIYDQVRGLKKTSVRKQAVFLPVKIADTFWTIVVESSEDEALASLESFRNKLIAVMVLLLLGSALFSFYGMRARAIIRVEAKRQKIEEELRESEERYRDLVENATDLICTHDLKGTLLSVNAAAVRAIGYEADEVVGLCLRDILPQGHLHEFDDYIKAIQRDGAAAGIMSVMTRGGELRYWEYRNTLRTEGVTEPVVRGMARDVTGEVLAKRALTKSEKRYRMLFERNLAGVYRTSLDGRVLDCNDAFARIYGFDSRNEAIRHAVENFYFSPEDRQKFVADLQAWGIVLDFESRGRRKDGSLIWLLENASLVQGESEGVTVIEGMLIDITERKQLEEELSQIFSMSLDMICIADINTATFLKVNPAFTETLGYEEKELLEKPFLEFIHPEDAAPTAEVINEKLLKGEKLVNFENRYRCKDGSYKWLNWLSHPVPEKGITYAVAHDVTEHKRSMELLRESEEKYRLIFDYSPLGLLYFDQNGVILTCNDNFVRIIGSSRDKLVGLNMLDLPDKKIVSAVQKALEGSTGIYEDAYRSVTADKVTPVRALFAPVNIGGGRTSGGVGIIEDITERKIMEEEIMKADKLESVGILAGGIAHDFNNILTSIIGNVALARMQVKPGNKIFDLLNAAETASMRAQGLTRQLLTFAKGGAPLKETASIKKLIMESSLFVLQGSKSGCEFRIAEDLWLVEADAGQISQVMSNIVINANQAMPKGGTIRITAENLMSDKREEIPVKPGRYIHISIKDQGVGIAEDHLSKIFDPYFTTKNQGSGLGLAAVYSIIKNHKGYISVDSLLGAGTTFHIYLPASDKEILLKEEFDLITGRGRILLMDDDIILKEMAEDMLKMLGYETEFAKDGTEAIEMYKEAMKSEKSYNAVILDLTIPGGMGGKEAVKKLFELNPELRAIVFSGYSNDPVMSNYREYGFKGMLAKPFDFKTLSRVLNEVLKE